MESVKTQNVVGALEAIANQIPAELRRLSEDDPVVGVSVVAMRLASGVDVLSLAAENSTHVDAPLAMLKATIHALVEREPNERVKALLKAAEKQVAFACRIKNGELYSNVIN